MSSNSAEPTTFLDIREAAQDPWRGLTTFFNDQPFLVIAREGDLYVLEGEDGTIQKHKSFNWNPATPGSKLAAASRLEGSPFAPGERAGGYIAGTLQYHEGEWYVKDARNTEAVLPLEWMADEVAKTGFNAEDWRWEQQKMALNVVGFGVHNDPQMADPPPGCPFCESHNYDVNPSSAMAYCSDCGNSWEVEGDPGEEGPDHDPDFDHHDWYPDWAGPIAAFKEAAVVQYQLPPLGLHVRTSNYVRDAGLRATVTFPPGLSSTFPDGLTAQIPSTDIMDVVDYILDAEDEHGMMPDQIEVQVDTEDPQAVIAIFDEQGGRGVGGHQAAVEGLKCPHCGGHTLRAYDVEGGTANMNCLTCGQDFERPARKEKKDGALSWGDPNPGQFGYEAPQQQQPGFQDNRLRDQQSGQVSMAYPDGTVVMQDGQRVHNPQLAYEYFISTGDQAKADQVQQQAGGMGLGQPMAAARHTPGTRVELDHKNVHGRGTIVEHGGTHDSLGEDYYTVLLDNGEEVHEIPESLLKRIKSAGVWDDWKDGAGSLWDDWKNGVGLLGRDFARLRSTLGDRAARAQLEQELVSKGYPPNEIQALLSRLSDERQATFERDAADMDLSGIGDYTRDPSQQQQGMPMGQYPLEPGQTDPNVDVSPRVEACPNCGGPGILLGEMGDRIMFRCRDCGVDFNTPAKREAPKVSAREYQDITGSPLRAGEWYEMFHGGYKVPDVVKVLNLEDDHIEAHIYPHEGQEFPLRIEATDDYTFAVTEARTSAAVKQAIHPDDDRRNIDDPAYRFEDPALNSYYRSEPGGDRDIFDARQCPNCGGSVTPNNDTVGVEAECGHCGRVYNAELYDTLPQVEGSLQKEAPSKEHMKGVSPKRNRQYEHIYDQCIADGGSVEHCKELAARTVNKQRAEKGETKGSGWKAADYNTDFMQRIKERPDGQPAPAYDNDNTPVTCYSCGWRGLLDEASTTGDIDYEKDWDNEPGWQSDEEWDLYDRLCPNCGKPGTLEFDDAQRMGKLARKNYTPSEQRALIDENKDGRARNYDKLNLGGTHYHEHEASDDDPDFLWGI